MFFCRQSRQSDDGIGIGWSARQAVASPRNKRLTTIFADRIFRMGLLAVDMSEAKRRRAAEREALPSPPREREETETNGQKSNSNCCALSHTWRKSYEYNSQKHPRRLAISIWSSFQRPASRSVDKTITSRRSRRIPKVGWVRNDQAPRRVLVTSAMQYASQKRKLRLTYASPSKMRTKKASHQQREQR